MDKYLIKEIRDGKEVNFALINGNIDNVKLAIAIHEWNHKGTISGDIYEVCKLDYMLGSIPTVYKHIVTYNALDFAKPF